MSSHLLIKHDVEQRFRAQAALGSAKDSLNLLVEFEPYDREHALKEEDSY